MADRVGQQFGQYRLTRFLGRGSFGEVYLGEQVRDKTLAAVKLLQGQLTEEGLKGFINEASATFRLQHPHIVRLLDFGIGPGDTPFLTMDYASNGTLRQRHPRGTRLLPETVVSYVTPIAAALQHAHDQRLVHRDVKPENILLGPNNEVWLSDFGISALAHSTRSLNTERSGGTLPYMAPEQLQGKPRPASDQYALGIMVYEWLCGERPFSGMAWEIVSQHLSTPPPPLRGKVPTMLPEVEQVVMTALAKDYKQRFGSVRAFANALEQACQRSQRHSPTLPILLPSPDHSWESTYIPLAQNQSRQPTYVPPFESQSSQFNTVSALIPRPPRARSGKADSRVASSIITVLILLVILLFLGLSVYLAGGLGFISLPFLTTAPMPTVTVQIPVPYLIGLSYQAAQAQATSDGFQLKIDNGLTSGTVINQSPKAPATTAKGSTITVDLQASLTVPDGLVGETLAAAEATLNKAGITNYEERTASPATDPTKGPNTVVEVRPTSGTIIDSNTLVRLYVVNRTDITPTVAPDPGFTFCDQSCTTNGYSVEYPRTWEKTTTSDSTGVEFKDPRAPDEYAAFKSTGSTGAAASDLVNTELQNNFASQQDFIPPTSSQSTTIANTTWVYSVATYTLNGQTERIEVYATVRQGKDYIIELQTPDAQFDNVNNKYFVTMLGSFQFE